MSQRTVLRQCGTYRSSHMIQVTPISRKLEAIAQPPDASQVLLKTARKFALEYTSEALLDLV